MNEDISIIESIREIEKLSRKAEKRVLKNTKTGITLRLIKSDEIYEKYSNHRDKQISHEILEYIEDQVKYIPVYSQLTITIESDENNVVKIEEQNINDYRELIEGNYRIIFAIQENTVIIHTIIDSRRNVEEIIISKLMRYYE